MSAIFYKDNPYGGTTTVTDAGHVLVTQGGDTTTAQAKFNTQTTAIQRILGNFATVEQSTTASKAYNVGDYLVLNSFLYKVTQVIAAGDTIDNTQNGNVVKTNAGAEFKNANSPVMELTKAQYDALPESVKNDGTIYLITDGDGGWEAEDSVYDNTESGLTATNVQDAVDELNSNVGSPSSASSVTGSDAFSKINALASANGMINVYGTGSSFDVPPKNLCRISSAASGTNPYSVIGGNQWVVFTMITADEPYNVQLAFGFSNDKLAIRRRNGGSWTSWVAIQ